MNDAHSESLPADSARPEVPAEPSKLKRRLLKTGAVMVILFGGILLLHLTPLRRWLEDANEAKTYLEGFGLAAPLVFTAALAALAGVGVPRLLLCSLSGALFGVFEGLLWGQIGTILGGYVTFVFARWAARGTVARYRSRLGPLAAIFESPNIFGMILIRQLPITTGVVNLVLGASSIRHRTFLIGTLLGFLPEAIPATMFGAGLLKASPGQAVALVSVAGTLLLAVWIISAIVAAKYRKTKLRQEP